MQHLPVPHLSTALKGPLLEIERHLLAHQNAIECWLRQEFKKTPAPFYTSVDLRNAGFKLAPVDTNLFPAGFNNLNPDFNSLCIHAIDSAIEKACPITDGVLIIPENHTRNLFYLSNIFALQNFIAHAGYAVRIGSLNPEITQDTWVDLPCGNRLLLEPLERTGARVGVKDFYPCAVLLNNDLSAGRPAILEGIEQVLMPPLELGWVQRLKTEHFAHYRQVAQEFAERIEIDPWLIDPYFLAGKKVDFKKSEGIETLAAQVDELLQKIRVKYAQYGVDRPPFVIVKADSGTYGMSVMTVRSGEELLTLNKKQRNKMASGKEGLGVSNVIIQEGVYTFETLGEGHVAEPVVYMMDHFVVGGFYRVHQNKGVDENLNSPGMHFEPLAFATPCSTPDCQGEPDSQINRFYAYGVIARLAMLAAAREIAQAKATKDV